MDLLRRELYLALPGLLAVIFIILAIIGGVKGYSPVPYWDMWGAVDFFIKISNGNYSEWWAQHNEHRIVLARILSWIDFSFFHGSGIFLVTVNYVLVFLSFAIFYICLRERLEKENRQIGYHALALLLSTLLFSWIQQENLVWPFQISFFLAQLLPLNAFYLLHKSTVSQAHSNIWFSAACLTGFLSLGTLANGVLTLPLMVLLAAVLHMGWMRVLCLAFLTTLAIFIYFKNYLSPSDHGTITNSLLKQPFELLQYVLTYLGGPFHYISDIFFTGRSLLIAQSAAIFLVISCAFFAFRSIQKPSQSSLSLALLAFLLYIGGTALATGMGRVNFGIEQSLSSRYMTPALMAWSTLLILYAPALCKRISNYPNRSIPLLIMVQLLFLPYQLKALHSRTNELFERQVAALALELGVRDSEQISLIFPFTDPILKLAKTAAEKDLSIFGNPLIKDAELLMGQSQPERSDTECIGSLDQSYVQVEDKRKVRIQGWMTHPDQNKIPDKIHILNQNRKIVGYALTGQPTSQIKAAAQHEPDLSGFKGYLLSGLIGKQLILKGVEPDCEMYSMIPLPSYRSNQIESGTKNNYTDVKSRISSTQRH